MSRHTYHISLVCERNQSQVPASATAQPELRQEPALASNKCQGCAWELFHVISRLRHSGELGPALGSHDMFVQVEAGGTHVAHMSNATPLPSSSTGSSGRKLRARICIEKDRGQQFHSVDV